LLSVVYARSIWADDGQYLPQPRLQARIVQGTDPGEKPSDGLDGQNVHRHCQSQL